MNEEQSVLRQKEIRDKGFDMTSRSYSSESPVDYGKIKVGVKSLDDAILDLGFLKKGDLSRINKSQIIKSLADQDAAELRLISQYFYRTNGIYQKVCNYLATMYRFDWYLVPEVLDDKLDNEKVLKEFTKVLGYMDNSNVQKLCQDIALKTITDGVYYGYLVDGNSSFSVQELPAKYCRSRYSVGSMPAIEFNMRFFDEQFSDINYRMRVLKLFPQEFAKGYVLYKQGKLPKDFQGDNSGAWYLLDPNAALKFTANRNEIPIFVNAIPELLDLDEAQDLDRRKQMQKLLKIIVQKLPMDKNGDLIFDVDEARDIHNNAVEMLRRAVGVDVLTTFADIESIDMSDKNTTTTTDDLQKVERAAFNAMGVSQNIFNTEGNLSLEKSILNDEGSIRTLLLQLRIFLDKVAQRQSKNKKKCNFRLYMLETTQYNYKDLSKLYKEQVAMGYSKMLPQIALGHSQSEIINTAFFENTVLDLNTIMIPPLTSNTMRSEDVLGNKGQSGDKKTQVKSGEEKTPGRPETPDDQKSEKTIQNKESMS